MLAEELENQMNTIFGSLILATPSQSPFDDFKDEEPLSQFKESCPKLIFNNQTTLALALGLVEVGS